MIQALLCGCSSYSGSARDQKLLPPTSCFSSSNHCLRLQVTRRSPQQEFRVAVRPEDIINAVSGNHCACRGLINSGVRSSFTTCGAIVVCWRLLPLPKADEFTIVLTEAGDKKSDDRVLLRAPTGSGLKSPRLSLRTALHRRWAKRRR